MTWLRIRIRPLTAFGSPIRGDTLFGQICWAIRERAGEERLTELLEGYVKGRPFLVVSDGLPADHLPRPQLPTGRLGLGGEVPPDQRKAFKKRRYIRKEVICLEPDLRASFRRLYAELGKAEPRWRTAIHLHNSISRITGTTGDGGFAPYGQEEYVWVGKNGLDLHCVLDEVRVSRDELHDVLEDIGRIGFGRDASIGLGKFAVEEIREDRPAGQPQANAWLTLAPSAPQGGAWDAVNCFYQPFTRFGRHGSIAAVGRNPFKKPILLADTGAVLTPASFDADRLFLGRGLGGEDAPVSSDPAFVGTVHQGYAPVVAVRLPKLSTDDRRGNAAGLQEEREEAVR